MPDLQGKGGSSGDGGNRTREPFPPLVEQRFWSKVDKSGDCWMWTASRSAGGYGRFYIKHGETGWQAHRLAYLLLVGPIPEGMQIDHLCRVRACVNPAHLEPVTQQENLRRGIGFGPVNSCKTHCKYGHPFDESNTYRHEGHRYCRTCRREREMARRQAVLAAEQAAA